MTLDPILMFLFPLILIAIALIFDSLVFSFFGGISAIFVGLEFMSGTLWVGMIFLGLGVIFMLIAALADWGE